MSDAPDDDLRLTKDGELDRRNYVRRGYERLTWGVYGKLPDTSGLDAYQARRAHHWARVRAILAAHDDAPMALAGPTALQACGVALPSALEDWQRCHLVVPSGAYRPERADVVAHRSRDFRVWAQRRGMACEHVVDAWMRLDGASLLDLVEVGDGLVRRKRPLLAMEQIKARLDELAGRPGVVQVRRALEWVRPGTDSLYETRTRLTMMRAGLPEPAVNPLVHIESADTWYRIDMAYADARVGVEYDGLGHVGNRHQMDVDAIRRRELQDEGWLIITVTASQLAAPGPFLRSVERALALRDPHG